MSWFELLLIGVGLAMDAFAVAICRGLAMKTVNRAHTFVIALFFGGFQALMPLIGWALGRNFSGSINALDHWIAWVLLCVIGGKMLWDGWKGEKIEPATQQGESVLNLKELTLMAVATSIDALAIGVSFALLDVDIVHAISLIGGVTFIIAYAGVFIGNLFGARFKNKAEIAGGGILVLIGFRILLNHLQIIPF